MSDECSDDGDVGRPTSQRYLYEMDRENLFAIFVGAVASLSVDDTGAHCFSAEAQALSRMARAVQARTDSSVPRESELAGLATVTRVLLSRTDNRDRGTESYWYEPISDLVGHFVRLRTSVGDFIPAASPEAVPGDLAAMDEPQDEVSPGEDIVTVEGGYRWHTDGRPPEPVH